MSAAAGGVGFTTAVQISGNLQDELQPRQNEVDGDYDQRLYDTLWLAHFKLSLENNQSATFNFTFPRKYWKPREECEISLRVRVVKEEQDVRVGLLQDFSEMTRIYP